MVEKRTVVLYPHLGSKSGTGHLKRLIPFFTDERFITYIIHRDETFAKEALSKFNIDQSKFYHLGHISQIPEKIDLIILDNKDSDRYLFDKLKNIAPILGLDECGDARNFMPYTLDLLPNMDEKKPNYFNPGLLNLKYRQQSQIDNVENILVTFGGQDPYNLTEKVVDRFKDEFKLTTIIGPLFKKNDYGVPKIEKPENLKEIMGDFDLVITSFGITAYEALALDIPVVLINPTEYHQNLSDNAGFYSIDLKKRLNIKKAISSMKNIELGNEENLLDFVYQLDISSAGCPLCNRKSNNSIARFKYKSYFYCTHCNIDYLASHQKITSYDKDYFFTEYKEQYGKTYLEDFEHIKNVGQKRLLKIARRIKKGDAILDIGCAYGPFLKACELSGYIPLGLDVSIDAIEYVTDTLGYQALVSKFPLSKPLPFESEIKCVTMWFVIEHFIKLDDVLSHVNLLLPKHGVFAFSTPNGKGISGRKNYKDFLSKSPNDHFTIWNHLSVKKVLKEYGFKVYKIEITGHHPERFYSWVKGRFLINVFMLISKIFKLGDTFEVYCIKENNL